MGRKTPEGKFKEELTQDLKDLFPGCVLLKNDEQLLQGVPDILILYQTYWAMLEVKESATADKQPNQDYYIEMFNSMSYASFVYPENKEEVLLEIQQAFSARRQARLSQC